jgi:O-antigen ligase
VASLAAAARTDRTALLICLGALLAAFICGMAFANGVALGVVVLIALAYAPLVFLNLPLAVVLFIPIVFFTGVPTLRVGPTLAGMLIFFAWFGTLLSRDAKVLHLVREQRRYLVLAGALLLWINLSLAWSREPASGTDFHLAWIQSAVAYVIVITTLTSSRLVRLAASALVFGAVASVIAGLSGGLESSVSALELAANEGRLGGGSGDPNYLAAGIVPSALLAAGLAAGTKRPLVRVACAIAIAVLVVGFAATESRGGLVAAVMAVLAALVFFKRRRATVAAMVLLILGIGAAWFSVNPDAWQRISNFDSSGTGRSELWSIAWDMGIDHPVIGVGLQNFIVVSPSYVDSSGPLEFAQFISEKPLVAHNVYVQLFAEFGVIGLALYLTFVVVSLRAAVLAARRYEERANRAMTSLARAVLVAGLATLAASFFISDAHERRNWITFALGPALLAASRRPEDNENGGALGTPVQARRSLGR